MTSSNSLKSPSNPRSLDSCPKIVQWKWTGHTESFIHILLGTVGFINHFVYLLAPFGATVTNSIYTSMAPISWAAFIWFSRQEFLGTVKYLQLPCSLSLSNTSIRSLASYACGCEGESALGANTDAWAASFLFILTLQTIAHPPLPVVFLIVTG